MATKQKLLLVEHATVDADVVVPGDMPVAILYDSAIMEHRISFQVPDDFDSFAGLKIVVCRQAAKNIYINVKTQKVTAATALSTSATGLTALAVTAADSLYEELSIAATAYSSLIAPVPGDIVTITVIRDASNALDTYNTDLLFAGVRVTYTLNSVGTTASLGMTLQQIVENVLDAFPQKTDTQIKIDVNQAQKRFVEKTRCYIKDADLTLNGTLILSYPSDMIAPISIQLFDSVTNRLDDVVQWEVVRSKIEFTDLDDVTSLIMPADIARMSLKYAAYPVALTADGHYSEIPPEFHEALEYAVLAKYYQKAGKWQQARECLQIYSQFVLDAKCYANGQFIGGWASVEPSAI
jgi:hypothetical protein